MGLHPFKIYFKYGGGGSSAPAWSLFGDDREKTKEYNDKMKNGDEKWNSVLYDYKHMRYIHGGYSSWWLLEKIK